MLIMLILAPENIGYHLHLPVSLKEPSHSRHIHAYSTYAVLWIPYSVADRVLTDWQAWHPGNYHQLHPGVNLQYGS